MSSIQSTPRHAALRRSNLAPEVFPTLKEAMQQIKEREIELENDAPAEESEAAAAKAKKQRDRERSVFFPIGYSTIWARHGEPIHKRLKRLRDKYGLTWLRRTPCRITSFPT